MTAYSLKTLKYLLITVLTCLMSGCILLLLGGPAQLEPTQTNHVKNEMSEPCPKARVYTMRGFLDIFSTGMYSLATKIHNQLGIQATSLSHLETKRLSRFLIKEYQSGQCRTPIILIGHSYGADDQVIVAKQLNQAHVPVELLITLDHTTKQTIPSNVRMFYNINSGKSIISGLVPWGCPMMAESKNTRMMNINLVKDKGFRSVNHFIIDKSPQVQSYIVEIIRANLMQ